MSLLSSKENVSKQSVSRSIKNKLSNKEKVIYFSQKNGNYPSFQVARADY